MSLYENEVIVVLGLGPAGLFISRQLKKEGVSVIGICKKDDIGQYSNSLSKVYIADSSESLKESIVKIHTYYPNSRPSGLICSDGYLTYIIEDVPEVFQLLDFSYPGEKTLRLFYDKEILKRFCESVSLPLPRIYGSFSKIDSYPIIVKPKVKRASSIIPKISFIYNTEDLKTLYKAVIEGGLDENDLIIQQMISGNNGHELGYGGYFENGKIVNDVLFRQVRQYPQGVSCRAIEISDPKVLSEIRALTRRFITSLNYSGFLQFDIKQDSISKKFFVLDINPRPWGSISIMTPASKNKEISLFRPDSNEIRNRVWHFPLKEIFSITNKQNVSFRQCRDLAKDMKRRTIIDIWDKNDIRPFIMQLIISFRKLI